MGGLLLIMVLIGVYQQFDGGDDKDDPPFAEYRDELINEMEGAGDRVETIEMVPDGNREVLRVSYFASVWDGDIGEGFDIAARIQNLWDGNEKNGSALNFDLTVKGEESICCKDEVRKHSVHYLCPGEVMDRMKSRTITVEEWLAACGVKR